MDDYSDLYQQMLNYYCSATRHTPDQASDIAIRIQVLAAQLEKLVSQAREVERDAFPATAVGEALERHAALRGLTRKEGTKATCAVIFRRPSTGYSLVIPAGTLLQTGGSEALRYVTQRDVTMLASSNNAVSTVEAVEAGAAYNVKLGNITVMVTPPQGVTEMSQLTDCMGGSDPEGDESLRARLLDSCRRPGVGGSPGYYRELLLSQQEVGKAKVLPTFRGRGTVDLVAYGVNGPLSEYQLENLQKLFQEQRELGVDVLVRAPQTTPVNLELSLAVETGWDFSSVSTAVEEALRAAVGELDIGAPWLLAAMNRVVMEVPGVHNCVITLPAVDTYPLEDRLLTPSGITIHAMEVSV